MLEEHNRHDAGAPLHSHSRATSPDLSAPSPLGAWVERYSAPLCALFLALEALLALGHSALRNFFYDEIVTVQAASLPSWHDVWSFYARGLDTPSPISSLVVRPFLHWPGCLEINVRLPFTLAFLCMSYCLYRLVHRRYPAGYALAALLAPTLSEHWFFYAVEARAYAFMIAGVAFAFVCWQSAGERKHSGLPALGIWLGLSLAMFAHAFTFFVLLPLGAAQWLRDREQRRHDLRIWAAFLLCPLGYLPALPGEALASHFYRGDFFARPKLSDIAFAYGWYLGFDWFPLTGILAIGLIVAAFYFWSASHTRTAGQAGFTRPEWLLLLSLSGLPIYGVLGAMVLGAFRDPYTLSFNIGLWIAAIALAAEAMQRKQLGGIGLLGFCLLNIATGPKYLRAGPGVLLHPGLVHARLNDAIRDEPLVHIASESHLPVVVGDHVFYSTLATYGDPSLASRINYIIDPVASAPFPKGTTSQTNFRLFGPVFGWHAPLWPDFAAANRHFLLLEGDDPTQWFFAYLSSQTEQHKDLRVTLVGDDHEGYVSLYDVQLGPTYAPPRAANSHVQ